MGQRITSIFQRNDESVQEVAIANSNAYRWPPKTGNYFGSHFIMGGERFDSQQPEAFLFGENADLNFLGNRPMPFPYPAPQLNEPTRTLRSLVNIRKDTVRLVRIEPEETDEVGAGGDAGGDAPVPDDETASDTVSETERDVEAGEGGAVTAPTPDSSRYNLEFTFDSDVTCQITVMYFAKEEVVNGAAVYTPRDADMNSETYTYKRSANQVFTQSSHILQPGKYNDEDWSLLPDKEEIPIVIQCTVESEPDHAGHSHMTFCVLEKLNDGYSIKALKQKQCVDGLLYILQEFYGIENKEDEHAKVDDEDDFGDNTAECVICMSDIRDTLILPCRHLCLCNGCADSLRYQANNCPICRAPFRALLQLRAIRKKGNKPDTDNNAASDEDDELAVSQKGVPQGFEAISLIEALNGPCYYSNKPADPKQRLTSSHSSLRRSKKSKKKDSKGSKLTLKDKNKDKDDIADEEKAQLETELQKTEGGTEKGEDEKSDVKSDDKTAKNDETEAEEEKEDDESQVTEKGQGQRMEEVTEKEKLNEDDKETDTSVSKDENVTTEAIKDGETADKTTPSPTKSAGTPVRSKSSKSASRSGDEMSIEGGSDSSCDDTLALSAVSQTTTLPGTPDHVLEDDEEVHV